ncbi:MAG: YggT family protein [Chloroflexi bacterium]|nr:YggT family protein [Chloroflexota bacterium]
MIINILITAIRWISQLLFLAILADVIISYFLPPYHSVRVFLDRLIEPMLAPIRRVIPPIQMIDLSPVILIIVIQIIEYLLVSILYNLR